MLFNTALAASLLSAAAVSAQGAPYTYFGIDGPLGWATLDPTNYGNCASDNRQSPINVDSSIPLATEHPVFNVPALESAPIGFDGHTVTTDLSGNKGTLEFGNKTYSIFQYHFHTPGEHFLDGMYFPMEMHMVFKTNKSEIMIFAQLFDIEATATTPLVVNTIKNMKQLDTSNTTTTGPLDFTDFLDHLHTTELYQYIGSFTNPPCTLDILWLVSKKPLPIDLVSWNTMKSKLRFNARYIQNTLGQPNLLTVV